MKVLEELNYTKTHEWIKVDEHKATIGLTDYAQKHLGQIVFVDLPNVGENIEEMAQLAEVESVKAVSEVYSPVSGKVSKINEDLLDNPGLINEDAYENWLVEIDMNDPLVTSNLLNSEDYEKHCDQLDREAKQ
jgi:glycine cleavage system H protein